MAGHPATCLWPIGRLWHTSPKQHIAQREGMTHMRRAPMYSAFTALKTHCVAYVVDNLCKAHTKPKH